MLGLIAVLTLAQPLPPDVPPESRVDPPPPAVADNVVRRGVFERLGSILGTWARSASFGPSPRQNPQLDAKFANAALGALLMTGGAFAVHELLGGRGEITLVLLTSIAVAGLSARVANTINSTGIRGSFADYLEANAARRREEISSCRLCHSLSKETIQSDARPHSRFRPLHFHFRPGVRHQAALQC
jgi:hypothetical protein